MSVLDDIVAGVREDLAARAGRDRPEADLRAALADVDPPRATRCRASAPPGSSVIAEVKRRSPSKGDLADIPDPAALAAAYAARRSRRDQRAHRAAPVRRQPRRPARRARRRRRPRCCARTSSSTAYQLLEARAAGADLVLLIVAALDRRRCCGRLHDQARELGLTVLVEVHDEAETERAVDAGRRAGRRQRPQPEDPRRSTPTPSAGWRRCSPTTVVKVAESGISGPDDVRRFVGRGRRRRCWSARRWSRTATPSGAVARDDRSAGMTTPSTHGCDADEHGWFGGRRAGWGGRFMPEALVAALDELTVAWQEAMADPAFIDEFDAHPARVRRAAEPALRGRRGSREQVGCRILLKREDLNHTGAHKIRNVLGQALLTRRMGKTRVIAETGAGQHGVASATAAAYFGLDCTVYMGAVDTKRQALNVARMQLLGAKVVPVDSGSATLKDAINEALRDWVASVDHTAYLFGTAAGPHPFPSMVRDFTRGIGDEARAAVPRAVRRAAATRSRPASAAGPTRSGCSPRSSTTRRGDLRLRGRAARASTPGGTPRRSTPATRACCTARAPTSSRTRTARPSSRTRSRPGSTTPASARSTPTSRATGRATYLPVTDAEAMDAMALLSRTEGIIPAIESAHAVAGALEVAERLRPPDEHHAGQPLRPRRQGHGHRDRVVRPRRRRDQVTEEPMRGAR